MLKSKIWSAGVLCAMAAGGGFAQESNEGEAQEKDDLLAGPDVREEEADLPADFTGASQRAAAVITSEVWMRTLRSLSLTVEQAAQIGAIEQEVRQALLEFRRTYGEELREFERVRREAIASGKRPSPEMQLRYAEINTLAPSAVDAQERIWALLTDDQKADMSTRLEQVQQRIVDERRRRAAGPQESGQPMDQMMQGAAENGERTIADNDIDEAGQRRLRFLRARQLSRPPGTPPSDREREFRFEDHG